MPRQLASELGHHGVRVATPRTGGVARGGGTAVACDSRNTKLAELRFRARLTEDGARQREPARA